MASEQNSERVDSDESALFMPEKSKYAGQKIDVSSRRSIEIDFVEVDGHTSPMGHHENLPTNATHVVVKYFYHREEFWRARVPLDCVDEIYGQCFNFSEIKMKKGANGLEIIYDKNGLPKRKYKFLNHLQSRFKLKPECPIELFSMEDLNCVTPLFQITDFIYSLETIGPPGVIYNVIDGLRGHLIATHRVLSTEEMVFERIVVQNEYVVETKIRKIGSKHKRELLVRSLLRSHRAGMSERYFLLRLFRTNNCTSSPFRILDSVARYGFIQWLGTNLYRFPISPLFYLRVRGFVSASPKQKMVREEFEEYIQDPETQQRKALFLKRKSRAKREARSNDE